MKKIKQLFALLVSISVLFASTTLANTTFSSRAVNSYDGLKTRYHQLAQSNPTQIAREKTKKASFESGVDQTLYNDFNTLYQVAYGGQKFKRIEGYTRSNTSDAAIIYDEGTKSYLFVEGDIENDILKITINNDEYTYALDSDGNILLSSGGNQVEILSKSIPVPSMAELANEPKSGWIVEPGTPGVYEYTNTGIINFIAIVAIAGDLYTYKISSTLFHVAVTFTAAAATYLGIRTVTLYIREYRYVRSDCVLYGRKVIDYYENSNRSGTPAVHEDFTYWLAEKAGSGCDPYPYP